MKPEDTPRRHHGWKDVHWPMVIYFVLIHAAAGYGTYLLFYSQIPLQTKIIAFVFHCLGALGITAGAHRLWTHRSYKATRPLEYFLAFCVSIANQGSIYKWCRDHVVHHKYSETVADPHDARRGFFFSHIGWLLLNKLPEVTAAEKQFNYNWLKNNPVIMFHHAHYLKLAFFCCFFLPALIAHFMWDDFWGGLFVAGFLKYAVTLHSTWCINSFAHLIGERPYDEEINPRDNFFTTIFALGEGWHNYHHTFPRDYAASEFGFWSQWNPTKLFIDFCAKVGLAYDLNKEHIRIHKRNYAKGKLAQAHLD